MNSSPDQLMLRVLIGVHAGAKVMLNQAHYLIGNDPESDIVLSDMTIERAKLAMHSGETNCSSVTLEAGGTTSIIEVNRAHRIGEIVIVIANKRCPSDLELMTGLFSAPAEPVTAKKEKKRFKLILALSVAIVAFGSTVMLQASPDRPVLKKITEKEYPITTVKRLIATLNYPGIHITARDNLIIVDGILGTKSDANKLKSSLNSLKINGIEHNYAVESEIISVILQSLAQPGIYVRYVGTGKFEVSGISDGDKQLEAKIKQLAIDLSPNVQAINVKNSIPLIVKSEEPEADSGSHGYRFKHSAEGIDFYIDP